MIIVGKQLLFPSGEWHKTAGLKAHSAPLCYSVDRRVEERKKIWTFLGATKMRFLNW